MLWRKSEGEQEAPLFENEEHDEVGERWTTSSIIRLPEDEDVFDLAWSPDGTHFVIGTSSNEAIIYEVKGTHPFLASDSHSDLYNFQAELLAKSRLSRISGITCRAWRGIHGTPPSQPYLQIALQKHGAYTTKHPSGSCDLHPESRLTKITPTMPASSTTKTW